MFFRSPSDVQIETLRNKVVALKESKEQVDQLKGLSDWEFTRLVCFPETDKQFKSLLLIIAKDETLIKRYSKAIEQFVRFSESAYTGGFVWGTTPRPPQGTKRYSGGPVWCDVSTPGTNAIVKEPSLSPKATS